MTPRGGFFYIELLVAVAVVALVTPALYSVILGGYHFSSRSLLILNDTQLAASIVDQVRALPHELLPDGDWTFTGAEETLLLLPDRRKYPLLTPNRDEAQRIRVEIARKPDEPEVKRVLVTIDRPGGETPALRMGSLLCPN